MGTVFRVNDCARVVAGVGLIEGPEVIEEFRAEGGA
jgi:hypothetical protein